MTSGGPVFKGFNKDTFKFLAELEKEKNNNTKWFAANRERYDKNLVEISKSFVLSIGQFFNHLNPSIRTEPKFNKTLMRINKDMRFAKGGPYKNYFLIHFGRFKLDSEFYVYLDKNGIEYGMFLNNTAGDDLYFGSSLARYKKEITEACMKYKINGKFALYELHKEPEMILKKFNMQKDYARIQSMKYVLLQKDLKLDSSLVFSPDFLTEAIKSFSRLYPLYCFAVSPQPLRLLDDFEERLGVAV